MTINVEMQRKYKFAAKFVTERSPGEGYNINLDKFTYSDRMGDAITRNNAKLGQINLVGPLKYGDVVAGFALRLTAPDTPNLYAQLLKDLESMIDSDYDTCDVYIYLQNNINGQEENSYTTGFYNCRLRGIKIDDLDSRGDDDMVHVTITLLPGSVIRTAGKQIENETLG